MASRRWLSRTGVISSPWLRPRPARDLSCSSSSREGGRGGDADAVRGCRDEDEDEDEWDTHAQWRMLRGDWRMQSPRGGGGFIRRRRFNHGLQQLQRLTEATLCHVSDALSCVMTHITRPPSATNDSLRLPCTVAWTYPDSHADVKFREICSNENSCVKIFAETFV